MFFSGTVTADRIAVVLLGLALATAPAAVRQPGAAEVPLYVTVEHDGGLVQGLTERNFRLREDGEPRPFRLAPPETPASIAMVVEYSRSSWLYFGDIAAALQGFLNAAPEGHWYALAVFDHGLTVVEDFTRQKGKITSSFSALPQPGWNEIDTYDAVYEVLGKMVRLPGRRVLILIGSGFDTFSSHTFDDVQKKIEASNVVVYGVGAGSVLRGQYEPYLGTSARMDLLRAESFLRMLADKSGGQAWFPRFEGAYPDVMRGVMQTLANQYTLWYTPAVRPDGDFHRIQVEAFQIVDDKRQDFKVRVREGWRWPRGKRP